MSSNSRNGGGQQCPIVFSNSHWRGTFVAGGPAGQPTAAGKIRNSSSLGSSSCSINANGSHQELSEAQWFAQQLEDPANQEREVQPDDWLEWAATFG